MEPANIDWKSIESRFVRDELYEYINAPKWIDLAAPDSLSVLHDDAWFCRPDCRHPKTADDFQRSTPNPKATLLRSNSERNNNKRDAALKRRIGLSAFLPSTPLCEPLKTRAAPNKFQEDLENQDPNRLFASPVESTTAKHAIKSSADKRELAKGMEEPQHKKPPPRLRSTFSARNLFSKDILSQISEFCHELKKLAMRKDSGSVAEGEVKKEEEEKKALLEVEDEQGSKNLNLNLNQNLDSKRDDGSAKKGSRLRPRIVIEKEKHKKCDENSSSSVLREVRAWPPTPQRFPSPSNRPPRKAKASGTTNSPLNRPPKSTALERGILQEVQQSREEKKAVMAKDEDCNKTSDSLDTEGRSEGGVFWFLKPCNYLV